MEESLKKEVKKIQWMSVKDAAKCTADKGCGHEKTGGVR